MTLPYRNILVLAPHTDDGEFGCGASIHRLLREGAQVRYVAFSDCKESIPKGYGPDTLEREMLAATQALGISDTTLLNYRVRRFSERRQDILEDMIKIGSEYSPDLVLTPCRQDIHQDHSTITTEAIRAFKSTTIWGYELPWNNLDLPSHILIRHTSEDMEAKLKAIRCYESQAGRPYSSEEYIRALSLTRGTRVRASGAEAFEHIRQVH